MDDIKTKEDGNNLSVSDYVKLFEEFHTSNRNRIGCETTKLRTETEKRILNVKEPSASLSSTFNSDSTVRVRSKLTHLLSSDNISPQNKQSKKNRLNNFHSNKDKVGEAKSEFSVCSLYTEEEIQDNKRKFQDIIDELNLKIKNHDEMLSQKSIDFTSNVELNILRSKSLATHSDKRYGIFFRRYGTNDTENVSLNDVSQKHKHNSKNYNNSTASKMHIEELHSSYSSTSKNAGANCFKQLDKRRVDDTEELKFPSHIPPQFTNNSQSYIPNLSKKDQLLNMESEKYIDYNNDYFDNWSTNIDPEILATMSAQEKKRQDIINEIYNSEKSHNRILRLLEGVFYRPLVKYNVLPFHDLQLLFPPAFLQLKELHGIFEIKLKERRIEHKFLVRSIGDILVEMFEGVSGANLKRYAEQFCSGHEMALKTLQEKRAKDEHLHRFLTEVESHKACRRLQLIDLLPTVLLRLTKYPLLFENLYKIQSQIYPDELAEAEAIKKALESSKRILVDVNQAVKIAEDTFKLESIQCKLDKSSFDKETGDEYKNLDLTKLKLIHDGLLVMNKNPSVTLHSLLFENIMVLLQKHDDKYILKHFPIRTPTAKDNSKGISPIIYFDRKIYLRQSFFDKNTFFLLFNKAHILELTAPNSLEYKIWLKKIAEIIEKHILSNNDQSTIENLV